MYTYAYSLRAWLHIYAYMCVCMCAYGHMYGSVYDVSQRLGSKVEMSVPDVAANLPARTFYI